MSDGRKISYILACEVPDIFKGITTITGCMMGWISNSCRKNDPISVFQLQGTTDNKTYYNWDVDNIVKWAVCMDV